MVSKLLALFVAALIQLALAARPPPYVEFTQPTEGTVWKPGSEVTIKWKPIIDGISSSKAFIALYRGPCNTLEYLQVLDIVTISDESVKVKVPANLDPGNDYVIELLPAAHEEHNAYAGYIIIADEDNEVKSPSKCLPVPLTQSSTTTTKAAKTTTTNKAAKATTTNKAAKVTKASHTTTTHKITGRHNKSQSSHHNAHRKPHGSHSSSASAK